MRTETPWGSCLKLPGPFAVALHLGGAALTCPNQDFAYPSGIKVVQGLVGIELVLEMLEVIGVMHTWGTWRVVMLRPARLIGFD
jgi:hypothetical protein